MLKVIPLVLVVAWTVNAFQSGRRVTTPTPTAPAPIQPPVNPQPPLPAPTKVRSDLAFLPESILERQIQAIRSSNFRLADFHGKVIVINLWASWCGPCRREVPEYEKVRKAYAGREVEFVGLTAEDRKATNNVDRFLSEVSFGFRLGWADREMASILMDGKNSIPVTMVIDPAGRITKHWSGYSPGQSGYRLKQAIDDAPAIR